MSRRLCAARAALVAVPMLALGCFGRVEQYTRPPTPVSAGVKPSELVDRVAEADARRVLSDESLYQIAERVRKERQKAGAATAPQKTVLCLSGGGSYGAYTAGVLLGWTARGDRPEFDVVTGISTGALIAPLAFLGPQKDEELRRMYTMIRQSDLFRVRKSLKAILGEGFVDNSPFIARLQESVTPALLQEVAAEHAKGRRLYVGTTDLDGRRQVIWDLGAIASQNTPQALELFQNVILASASIPGFFPPVRIPVQIGSQVYEERHVDGGVSAAIFFRPPYVPQANRADAGATSLANTDVYLIIAGKLYADAEPVRARALRILTSSVSSLLYVQTRGDLSGIYTVAVLAGMRYHLAAVPTPVPITFSSTDFDPDELTKLFNVGSDAIKNGTAWRSTPPGLEKGEGVSFRSGTVLDRVPNTDAPPAPVDTTASPPVFGK